MRTKKGPLLCHTCTWFVTISRAPCYLAVTWERCRTKPLKGLCGVIGWFHGSSRTLELPLELHYRGPSPQPTSKPEIEWQKPSKPEPQKTFINRLRTSKRIGNSSRKQTSKNFRKPQKEPQFTKLQAMACSWYGRPLVALTAASSEAAQLPTTSSSALLGLQQ